MATSRLPGIYFETVPTPPPALLPRMDIAAFAGFTASGPVGLPFAVESPDRFQDVFGTDLPLAWDADLGEMRMAQTPPAVRSFFRNGGQRCWVVRLANCATANTWTIPGLLQVDGTGGYHAGCMQARSEGSWSDELTVNATLLESPLPAQSPAWPANGTLPPQPTGLELTQGDVAQLFFPLTNTLGFFDYSSSQWFWFEPADPAATSPSLGQPDRLFFLAAGADSAVPFFGFEIENSEFAVEMSRAAALTIPPGSFLRVEFGNQTLLMQVAGMGAGVGPFGSLPTEETATLTSTLAWWSTDTASAWANHQGENFQASIVTFQLWAWPAGAAAQEIAGLGFSQENPQYFGVLPTDALLYAPVIRPGPLPYAALASQIDNPRFPLAAPAVTMLGLPLGMTALVDPDFTQAATQQTRTALERDGLASFDPSLFIDHNLAGLNSATLLPNAYYWQYQAQPPAVLAGMHALLGNDEISMIAVPDAIHAGWQLSPAVVQLLAAPDHLQVSTPDESGSYTVSWKCVAGAAGYTLDESTDPTFATAVTSQDAGANQSIVLTKNSQCSVEFFYRVSAYGSAGDSPWSQTGYIQLGTGDFVPCKAQTVVVPQLTLIQEINRIILSWTLSSGTADSFTLQIADDPLFESGSTLYQGALTSFQYWSTPGPPVYFRVNAQTGNQSTPWSNTVNTAPQPPSPWQTKQFPVSGPPPVLIAVHLALLTMAAARGDLVAILSLPYVYRKNCAVTYRSQLLAAIDDPLPTVPSYGALYHPWIVTPDNTNAPPQSLRNLVPDGAVCGAIASTTLASGAWIAPANVAVSNAVALAPLLEPDADVAFAASQINLIAQQPEGFLIASQDTLMPDGDALEPLNVRRLLILLRRLALREGTRRVFENISPAFQRAVSRLFEQWMQLLLARGAFAGASAADSYQVIVDASVNTQTSIDQGRFIVVLKVAPSVPMQFLTVKLVQSGGQMTLVEG
jgi:hypothetical protein